MLEDLLNSKNYWDIYIIARWYYKNGVEFLDDKTVYDPMEVLLKKQDPNNELFKRSYMDDEEPTELMKKYNLVLETESPVYTSRIKKYYDILSDNKGISVKPIRSYEEAYIWYQNNIDQEIIHSVKINGVNTKSLVSVNDRTIIVTSSKASQTENFLDYTEAALQHYPKINTNFYRNIKRMRGTLIPVYCEAYVDTKGKQILENELGKKYVTERSAAVGVLRRNLVDYIPDNFHMYCYNCLDNLGSFEDGLEHAKQIGFSVVPYRKDIYKQMSFTDFCQWLDAIQEDLTYIAESMNMPYDGIVAQINNMNAYYQGYTDMYNSSNIALKLGKTGAEILKTTVTNITLVQSNMSSSQFTCKVLLEPVVSKDGNTVSEITGYNLGNIISLGIKVGDTVEVLYQSGCYPTLKGGVKNE